MPETERVSVADVRRVAELSNLDLTADEEPRMRRDLSSSQIVSPCVADDARSIGCVAKNDVRATRFISSPGPVSSSQSGA